MADKEHMELVEHKCTLCGGEFEPDDFFRGLTGRQHPTPRYHLGRVGFIGSTDGPGGADPLLKSETFPLCAGCYCGLVRLIKAGAPPQLSRKGETMAEDEVTKPCASCGRPVTITEEYESLGAKPCCSLLRCSIEVAAQAAEEAGNRKLARAIRDELSQMGSRRRN